MTIVNNSITIVNKGSASPNNNSSSTSKGSVEGLFSVVPLPDLAWGGRGKRICNNPQAVL